MTTATTPTRRPKVLVTDNVHPSALPFLEENCDVVFEPKATANTLAARIAEFDALLIRSESKISAELMAQATHLKIVGRAGVGVDNVDLTAANQHGILVVNSPEGNTVAASEHTIGLLFALARHIPTGDATMKASEWARKHLTGVELYGKTLGLIGLGKIGGRVARACHTLGMKVIVYDPFITAAVAESLGATQVGLPDIWAKSDFITVHVPKTKDTVNLINKETLALCKPGVRLVNCARGGIINELDLVAALESGHVAGAALDVFDAEPLATDSPLRSMGDKVVLTPHLGASTEEAQVNVALDVAEQIRDFFATGNARSAVNMPFLRADILEPVRPYMPLAEALGKLARQLVDGPVSQIEVIAKGTVSEHNIAPLSLAVLKGVFSLSREGVNYVNARYMAQERGITVQETKTDTAGSYANQVVVKLTTPTGVAEVAGTLLTQDQPRIIQIDEFATLIIPTANLLLVPHEDKPGMVAKVASLLGDEQINISSMQVGRDPQHQRNMMVFNLDSPVSEALLAQIAAIPGCVGAKGMSL
jgi:D-3-phosphoglycerate dehydrogenase / 2-oxoglutarate reductase